jgi:ubiquinol-cytochrome c reductase cytochrome b subunit
MVGLTLMHLALLHVEGSSNPLGVEDLHDFIPFYPYFLVKDIFGFLIFLFFFSYLVFFEPNLLGHPDNYIRANPVVTPPHIVPEWYFLPFYAILRAVPSKLGGVVAMGASIGILFLLPILDRGQFSVIELIGLDFDDYLDQVQADYSEIEEIDWDAINEEDDRADNSGVLF